MRSSEFTLVVVHKPPHIDEVGYSMMVVGVSVFGVMKRIR